MSMILLKIGVVLTPFYEILVKLFPYAGTNSPDTRVAKIFIGIWIALGIGLSACFSGQIRECKNKWILLFLIFIPLNIFTSPQYEIFMNGISSNNFWSWKPFVTYLSFFLMFMAVQSIDITKKDLIRLFNIMFGCGLAMAVYVLFQNYGWDQWFSPRIGDQFIEVTKPVSVGTLGNSTIVSPFIAMLIPFALYLRKWFSSIVMILAVFACQSEMAIGAMTVSLIAFSCLKWKRRAVIGVILTALVGIAAISWTNYLNPDKYYEMRSKIGNVSGRTLVWKESVRIVKEDELGLLNKSRFPFTGIGLGGFSVILKPVMKTQFSEAHNEYLQVFTEMGLVGLFLFLASIGYMIKKVFYAYLDYNKNEILALSTSFLCIGLVAFGTFIWQLSPHNYYTVLIVGLLHNRNLLKGELND